MSQPNASNMTKQWCGLKNVNPISEGMMIRLEIERFCKHLQARNYSRHTISNYSIDLRLFFEQVDKPLQQITWREVDQFVERQHGQGLAATTINRRLNAIKRFFDYLVIEQEKLSTNPVKPSHFPKQGRDRKSVV